MNSALAAAKRYSLLSEHTRNAKRLECDAIKDLSKGMVTQQADILTFATRFLKNERLWTDVGLQVANRYNHLSASLCARLLYMAQFVTRRASKIMNGKADVESFVEMKVGVLHDLEGTV